MKNLYSLGPSGFAASPFVFDKSKESGIGSFKIWDQSSSNVSFGINESSMSSDNQKKFFPVIFNPTIACNAYAEHSYLHRKDVSITTYQHKALSSCGSTGVKANVQFGDWFITNRITGAEASLPMSTVANACLRGRSKMAIQNGSDDYSSDPVRTAITTVWIVRDMPSGWTDTRDLQPMVFSRYESGHYPFSWAPLPVKSNNGGESSLFWLHWTGEDYTNQSTSKKVIGGKLVSRAVRGCTAASSDYAYPHSHRLNHNFQISTNDEFDLAYGVAGSMNVFDYSMLIDYIEDVVEHDVAFDGGKLKRIIDFDRSKWHTHPECQRGIFGAASGSSVKNASFAKFSLTIPANYEGDMMRRWWYQSLQRDADLCVDSRSSRELAFTLYSVSTGAVSQTFTFTTNPTELVRAEATPICMHNTGLGYANSSASITPQSWVLRGLAGMMYNATLTPVFYRSANDEKAPYTWLDKIRNFSWQEAPTALAAGGLTDTSYLITKGAVLDVISTFSKGDSALGYFMGYDCVVSNPFSGLRRCSLDPKDTISGDN